LFSFRPAAALPPSRLFPNLSSKTDDDWLVCGCYYYFFTYLQFILSSPTMMILALLLAFPVITAAQIVPTTPEEGQVFYIGQDCSTSWAADTAPDGWKLMRIGK
jgi:O-antigen ligase